MLATMSFFAARLGTMLSCASATSMPFGRPGRSRKYACDSRRSERSPDSGAATGASRSPSLMLPLINADTVPSRATSAARNPAARGSSAVSMIDSREMSRPALAAVSRMRPSGPISTWRQIAGERPGKRELQRIAVARMHDRRGQRRPHAGSFRRGAGIADAWPWCPEGRKPPHRCQHPPDRWTPGRGPAAGAAREARRGLLTWHRRTASPPLDAGQPHPCHGAYD